MDFFANEYKLVSQYGTHIDAPIHFVEKARSLDQINLDDFFLPLVVINKEQAVDNDNDYKLSVADIEEFE